MGEKAWAVAGVASAVIGSLVVTSVPAPAQSPVPAEDRRGSVMVGDVERTYRVHLPPGYQPDLPLPLVVAIHGGGTSTGDAFAEYTGLEDAVEARGWIVVFPDGLRWEDGARTAWNAGNCCQPAAELGVDDVGFIDALLDELTADLAVDPTRIYVTGASSGANLAHRLACELADRLAAVAPVAGVIDDTATCDPGRAVPMLIIHGRADRHAPFAGGSDLVPGDWPSVADATGRWRAINRCIGPAQRTSTTLVIRDRWSTCSPEGEVRLDAVVGFPHRWPGTYVGDQYLATPVVLAFFARHRLLRDYPSHPFADVADGAPASYAIDWAVATGVLGAVATDQFGPSLAVRGTTADRATARFLGRAVPPTSPTGDQLITRQATATLLAAATGSPLTGSAAVQWARSYGVIADRPGRGFDGAATITRAELASALYRLSATPIAWSRGVVLSPFAV
jgi:polyhydroxybutyrate depolymerase